MNTQQRETRDLYQQVTDQIIETLEHGVVPWVQPWDTKLPYNGETKREYSGINILLLWAAQIAQGFKQSQWLTFNGVKKLGGTIRRGEKSTQIILYRPTVTTEKDTEGNVIFDENGELKQRSYAVIRGIPVFNVEQCDGIKPHFDQENDTKPVSSDLMTQLLDDLPANLGVRLDILTQNRACYLPERDCIVMPSRHQFHNDDGWYATLLHESAHATGHHSRLNRIGITDSSGFGSPIYAFEELIAELTSAFMCAHAGISNVSQNAAYLDAWIKALKADKKAIFRATSQAREATDYLLNALHQPALQQAI